MKKLLVAVVIAGTFFSLKANAQQRAGSAALGAVSGAVVLGPVGAVAGALIGYTAGPAIAHSWGVGHSRSRRVTQVSAATEQQSAARMVTPLPAAKPAEAIGAGKSAPPVQGFD
ncbi:MAG: DNA-directed RNA polymerase subunit N [Bradyrhizobium sp.]